MLTNILYIGLIALYILGFVVNYRIAVSALVVKSPSYWWLAVIISLVLAAFWPLFWTFERILALLRWVGGVDAAIEQAEQERKQREEEHRQATNPFAKYEKRMREAQQERLRKTGIGYEFSMPVDYLERLAAKAGHQKEDYTDTDWKSILIELDSNHQ